MLPNYLKAPLYDIIPVFKFCPYFNIKDLGISISCYIQLAGLDSVHLGGGLTLLSYNYISFLIQSFGYVNYAHLLCSHRDRHMHNNKVIMIFKDYLQYFSNIMNEFIFS